MEGILASSAPAFTPDNKGRKRGDICVLRDDGGGGGVGGGEKGGAVEKVENIKIECVCEEVCGDNRYVEKNLNVVDK